jgi:4-hydroxybenzoate polyprenyltransferase
MSGLTNRWPEPKRVPVATGRITQRDAILFAAALALLGVWVLVVWVNVLTAVLTVASLIGYAFIYTMFLKRATPQNIVIGGLAWRCTTPAGLDGSDRRNSRPCASISFDYFCLDPTPFLGAGNTST